MTLFVTTEDDKKTHTIYVTLPVPLDCLAVITCMSRCPGDRHDVTETQKMGDDREKSERDVGCTVYI